MCELQCNKSVKKTSEDGRDDEIQSVEALRLKRSLLLQLLNVAWNLTWMWQIFFNILFLKALLVPVESNHKTVS